MSEFRRDMPRQPIGMLERLKSHKEAIGILATLGAFGVGVVYSSQGPDCEPTGTTVIIGEGIGPYDRPYGTLWEVALAANPTNPDGTYKENTSRIVEAIEAINPELRDRALQDKDAVNTVACSS